MSEQQVGLTVDQTSEMVVSSLERAVSEQLANYVDAVETINRTSLFTQKMATQRMAIGVIAKQRLKLQEQLIECGNDPIMAMVIQAQAEVVDEQMAEALVEIGVPKKIACQQIQAAVKQLGYTEKVVRNPENGRIKAFQKVK